MLTPELEQLSAWDFKEEPKILSMVSSHSLISKQESEKTRDEVSSRRPNPACLSGSVFFL
jgi:hypothetical protein